MVAVDGHELLLRGQRNPKKGRRVTESSCSFLEKCHSLWLLGNDRADHDDVVDDIES